MNKIVDIPLPSHRAVEVSEDIKRQLTPDNPQLRKIRSEYAEYMSRRGLKNSQWHPEFCDQQIEWPYFRGDNAYVWQERENSDIKSYIATTEYVRQVDTLNLLEVLREDGDFGVYLYTLPCGTVVSRDLLDSILEMNFLDEAIGLSSIENARLMDIGAGYGRLAYRMVSAYPNISQYFCFDAVPESSFLSDFYLNHKGVGDRACSVYLHDIDEFASAQTVDIALNIHSFSECSIESIKWWLKRVDQLKTGYLMIVPNTWISEGKYLISLEADNTVVRYEDLLRDLGYELLIKTPKYRNNVLQKTGVSPTYYYLYEHPDHSKRIRNRQSKPNL